VYIGAIPPYHKDVMTDLDREHLLQKIVAGSGFLFALLILPIAQYYLVNSPETPKEQGTVAGVSTDKTVTEAVVQDSTACTEQKSKDLSDLQVWQDGRIAALTRELDAAVQPYQQAIEVVTGENVEAEKAALTKLIADEQQAFEAKRNQIVAVVDAKVKELSTKDCGVVEATPEATRN
jgi:hypothetical protein